MHMQGEPRTMQDDPRYDDVVSEVKAFLEERLAFAVSRGDPRGARLPRPGIGFGKTDEHNFELVRRLPELAALGRPRRWSASRARARSRTSSATRTATVGTTAASVGAAVAAYERGATILRVHDVRAARRGAARAARAVLRGP